MHINITTITWPIKKQAQVQVLTIISYFVWISPPHGQLPTVQVLVLMSVLSVL